MMAMAARASSAYGCRSRCCARCARVSAPTTSSASDTSVTMSSRAAATSRTPPGSARASPKPAWTICPSPRAVASRTPSSRRWARPSIPTPAARATSACRPSSPTSAAPSGATYRWPRAFAAPCARRAWTRRSSPAAASARSSRRRPFLRAARRISSAPRASRWPIPIGSERFALATATSYAAASSPTTARGWTSSTSRSRASYGTAPTSTRRMCAWRVTASADCRRRHGRRRARTLTRESFPHRVIRAGTFLGLMLLFPCPFYMIAVGGLLPLPIIVSYGDDRGLLLAIALIHLVVYAWIFFWVARFIGWLAGPDGIRRRIVAVLVTAMLVAVSFVPIYDSGENLATGRKLRHTAWKVYRDAYFDWSRHVRR